MAFLLVHGAGAGPWVFEGWDLPGRVAAVDLQAGLEVAAASMLNYEAAVARSAERLERPLVLVGWSMGGLAAMLAARRVEPDALVLLEPSPPAEVRGYDASVTLEEGLYEAEPFPQELVARRRPDSLLARAERRRGISVASLPARTLVVHGDEYPREYGPSVAERYAARALHLEGASHWELVLGKKAAAAAVGWI